MIVKSSQRFVESSTDHRHKYYLRTFLGLIVPSVYPHFLNQLQCPHNNDGCGPDWQLQLTLLSDVL